MRPRTLSLVVMMCLAPAATWAQVGFRSAVVLEHRLATVVSLERADLFLARPGTYDPRLDGRRVVDVPLVLLGGPWYADIASGERRGDADGHRFGHERCAGVVRGCQVSRNESGDTGSRGTPRPHSSAADKPSVAPAVAVPAPPKTFFLIAGCYAGDRPPRQEWLAPGCDLSNVRVVGP